MNKLSRREMLSGIAIAGATAGVAGTAPSTNAQQALAEISEYKSIQDWEKRTKRLNGWKKTTRTAMVG